MLKRVFGVLLAVVLLGMGGVAYAEQSVEEECREIAKEEGVPAEEREDFIAQCVEEMKSESGEKKSND